MTCPRGSGGAGEAATACARQEDARSRKRTGVSRARMESWDNLTAIQYKAGAECLRLHGGGTNRIAGDTGRKLPERIVRSFCRRALHDFRLHFFSIRGTDDQLVAINSRWDAVAGAEIGHLEVLIDRKNGAVFRVFNLNRQVAAKYHGWNILGVRSNGTGVAHFSGSDLGSVAEFNDGRVLEVSREAQGREKADE